MRRILYLVLMLSCLYVAKAQVGTGTINPTIFSQVGITGNYTGPDGTPFNGTISLSLAKSTILNICAVPYQVVAIQPSVLTIVNGLITNGSGLKVTVNACLQPSIPYFVQVFDTKNNLVSSDNWWLPQTSDATINVGSLESVGFTGPIVVSIPQAIVGAPATGQTITQPGSTFLSVNNLTVTNQFTATNALAASVTGNAATANALKTTPTTCSGGYYAYGILTNGNALCSNAFPSNSSFGTIQVTGASNPYSSQGSYLNWNVNTGQGDMDFMDQQGLGYGGFNFYIVSNSGTHAGPVFSIASTGNVTSTGTVSAPSFSGPLTGNASSASALNHSPTTCSGGYASGISANGNAICPGSSGHGVVATTTFTTCSLNHYGDSDQNCTGTASWGATISGAYQTQCTLLKSYGGGADTNGILQTSIGISTMLTTGFTYWMGNIHDDAAGTSYQMMCSAIQ